MRNTRLILFLILLGAAAVRVWGINFGLPDIACRGDEEVIVSIAFSPFSHFHPFRFDYPSLFKYLNLCGYFLYYLFRVLTGGYMRYFDFAAREVYISPYSFYLIDRCLSALLGVGTVWVTYRAARALFDRTTALLSAFFLSLAYLHVRDSHFGTVDVPMAFFIMASVFYLIKSSQEPTVKNYVWAGICAGLAASTKYAGVLLCIPMCAVNAATVSGAGHAKRIIPFDRKALFFLIACALSFLAGTPYAALDFSRFLPELLEVLHKTEQGTGIVRGGGWWYHLRFTLFFGLGAPLFFSSLIGMGILFRSQWRKAVYLCSFPLVYYAIIGNCNMVFVRYCMPLVPFLCITGAVFAGRLTGLLRRYPDPLLRKAGVFLVPVLIIAPSFVSVVSFDDLLTKKDNRLCAAEWMDKNLKGGSVVAQFCNHWSEVKLYPNIELVKRSYAFLVAAHGSAVNQRIVQLQMEYLLAHGIKGFFPCSYDESTDTFTFNGRPINGLPGYIVVEESFWQDPLKLSLKEREVLQGSYTMLKAFKAINIANTSNRFDRQDAFYIPFTGFKEVERPGPNLYIYKRIAQ